MKIQIHMQPAFSRSNSMVSRFIIKLRRLLKVGTVHLPPPPTWAQDRPHREDGAHAVLGVRRWRRCLRRPGTRGSLGSAIGRSLSPPPPQGIIGPGQGAPSRPPRGKIRPAAAAVVGTGALHLHPPSGASVSVRRVALSLARNPTLCGMLGGFPHWNSARSCMWP